MYRLAGGLVLLADLFCLSGGSLLRFQVRRQPLAPVPEGEMVLLGRTALRGASLGQLSQQIELRSADIFIVADIDIGTPPQTIPLAVDVLTPNLLVASSPSLDSPTFESSESATLDLIQHDVGLEEDSLGENITGDLYKDTIQDHSDFLFYVADMNPPAEKIAGILGLSPSTGAEAPSVLSQLAAAGGGTKPVFALYLPMDQPTGELVLGGVDSSHYTGEFKFVPLLTPDTWSVAVDGVTFGETSIMSSQTVALLNPGNAFTWGPPKGVQTMAQSIGAVQHPAGFYLADCDAPSANLTITLGGTEYTMVKDFLLVPLGGGICVLTVLPTEQLSGVDQWTLGALFFIKYYVQFDADGQRIGVALAASTTSEEGVVPP